LNPAFGIGPKQHCKVRYRGLAKNTAQRFSLFALANLVLARRLTPPRGVIAS
jgi:IS5 family transposase